MLDIPPIPPSCITRKNIYSLPCAPLSLVLLLKLQAWVHHGESLLARYYLKKPMDARDIDALLPIAKRMGIEPRTESFLPESFVKTSELRVKKYVQDIPTSTEQWMELGYDVAPKEPVKLKPAGPIVHRRRRVLA